VAKGMAQKALAASPNPQWTEYEMQCIDEWIASQGGKLDRPEAIRRLVVCPAGFQAIVTAYGDYTKKSFEDTKSFVEKLSGVRSLDKAVEVQTEFAKSAFETFVTESQKISALYGDLAKQACKPFGGFLTKMTPTA
jgi:hypothetical protein